MAVKNISLNELAKLSGWFLALGILFVFFGFVLIFLPAIGTITIDLMFGFILLILGISEVAFAFMARKWTGFLFVLISGIISLIAAGLLLFKPAIGMLALTLFLGAFLIVQGAVKIGRAYKLKPNYQWEWLLFDAILSILLGALILLAWPSDASWVLGLLFGIDLLFGGLSLIMISQAVKN